MNEAGLKLIRHHEGCVLHAYQDIAGIWTIGYGHTENVHNGQTITQEQADSMLLEELQKYEDKVKRLVTVDITDNQLSALVSFAYNVGVTALANSTLLKRLNAGKYVEAADQFLVWNKARVKNSDGTSSLRPVLGLTRRRTDERDLFLTFDRPSA